MIHKRKIIALVVLLVVALLIIRAANRGGGQGERFLTWLKFRRSQNQQGTPTPLPSNPKDSGLVISITLVTNDGGRLDWSTANNLVAFDRRKSNSYYALYIASPDLANPTCLTCSYSQFEKRHAGNPAWTPDGNYIIFQAQSNDKTPTLDTPGKGVNNDLFLVSKDGSKLWQLTDLSSQRTYGILHPHFSHNGKQLLWAQLVSAGNVYGIWQLKVADFGFNNGIAQLSNIKTYTPGSKQGLYESHSFSPDGKYIYFSSNAFNQQSSGFDIYRMNLATGQVFNYNNSPADWDEHAQLSPNGTKIVWSSSAGQKNTSNDLWIMNAADGSDKTKLTDVHNPSSPTYVGSEGFGPADTSWSADGKQLLMYVIGDQQGTGGKIYLMKFK